MDDRDGHDPLRDLGDRLDKARQGQRPPARQGAGSDGGGNALGQGLRIGVELVVAIVVCVAIGWAIDRWLGTRPAGMLVFFFVGIGAGMWNVYRTVRGMGMAMGFRRQGTSAPESKSDWSDDED